MSDHIRQTIAEMQEDVRKLEAEAAETKRMVNKLAARAGLPLVYAEAELNVSASVPLSIQADQFYGQPLASCIRTILEMRRALKQGPASLNDIYSALIQGGYKFETKNEDNSKRGLRQSLTKNVQQFHKLPNGLFGLSEWYPNVKKRGAASRAEEPVEQTEEQDGGSE